MEALKTSKFDANENQIQSAITVYNTKQYRSIGKAARAFEVFYLTMKDCLSGAFS